MCTTSRILPCSRILQSQLEIGQKQSHRKAGLIRDFQPNKGYRFGRFRGQDILLSDSSVRHCASLSVMERAPKTNRGLGQRSFVSGTDAYFPRHIFSASAASACLPAVVMMANTLLALSNGLDFARCEDPVRAARCNPCASFSANSDAGKSLPSLSMVHAGHDMSPNPALYI